MESVLTAVIIITLLLFAVLTLSEAFLNAQETIHVSWQEMESRVSDQGKTVLLPLDAQILSTGEVVEVTLSNSGAVRLADFDRWDAIIQYYDVSGAYHVNWLNYLESGEPVTNQWTVKGIYWDAQAGSPEIYEQGVFNPDEQVVLRMRVSPAMDEDTTAMITFSAENGVGVSALAIPQISPE